MSFNLEDWSRTREAARRSDWTDLIWVEKDLEEDSRVGRVESNVEREEEKVEREVWREEVEVWRERKVG